MGDNTIHPLLTLCTLSPPLLHSLRKWYKCVSHASSIKPQVEQFKANPIKLPHSYYAEEMYRLWKQDPNSVHPSWSVYFSGMARGLKSEDAFRPPPNLLDLAEMSTEGSAELPISSEGSSDVQDHMKVRYKHSCSIHLRRRHCEIRDWKIIVHRCHLFTAQRHARTNGGHGMDSRHAKWKMDV